MAITKFVPTLAAFALLTACGDRTPEVTNEPSGRFEDLERKVVRLETRVQELESQTPAGQAAAAEKAQQDRLRYLKQGERQIEQNQKSLCDATGEC